MTKRDMEKAKGGRTRKRKREREKRQYSRIRTKKERRPEQMKRKPVEKAQDDKSQRMPRWGQPC
jgi:hypothetical protein